MISGIIKTYQLYSLLKNAVRLQCTRKEGDIIDTNKQFKRVGTHSGRFHADEVMSTAILKEIFDIELTRTRDTEVLNGLDLVYDVGNGEFDHHQIEKEYRDNGTPYAACGLIWRRFGKEVVAAREPALSEEEVNTVFRQIDGMLIEGIDAVDNGLRTCDTIIPTMNISTAISGFNPTWDSEMSEDQAFNIAESFASMVFRNSLNQRLSAIKAKGYVIDAYNNRTRPEVLVLDKLYPWGNTLFEIDTGSEVLFVIYPRGEEYMIQTVRSNDGSYRDRKSLPESWAGKREEELGEIIGIDDAVFCHPARFIAGAKSLESILKMADIAVSENEGDEFEDEPGGKYKEETMYGFILGLKKFFIKKRILIKR